MTTKIELTEDENVQQGINVSSLAKATYLLRIDVNNTLYEVVKFVKN